MELLVIIKMYSILLLNQTHVIILRPDFWDQIYLIFNKFKLFSLNLEPKSNLIRNKWK